jgi:hypothetical protein
MGAQKKTYYTYTRHPAAEHICHLSRSGSVDLFYVPLRLFRIRGFENLAWRVKMSTFEREGGT